MYTALHATSKTLTKFLETPLQAFFSSGQTVSLKTPHEMKQGTPEEGVSVWLYRIIRDDQRLNDPPRRLSATQVVPSPLPLRLHYLITPVTKESAANPETEQLILGKVLQLFHSHPVLRGADLYDEFSGDVELHVRLEPMTLEEITRVWEALEGSYQLSVSYEVSVVNIMPELEPEQVTPVDVVLPEYGLVVS